MTIILASDHGGFSLKESVKEHLSKDSSITLIDVGAYSEESIDYPLVAKTAAEEFKAKNANYIFSFCGTGIGISIALNKIDGIYCALVYNKETAILAKEHNNANTLSMGGRQLSVETGIEMVDAFLNATVLGDQHARRRKEIGY